MLRILILVALLSAGLPLWASHYERDSLLAILAKAGNDSSKVILLYHIGDTYTANDDIKATAYYTKAFELSKAIGFNRGIIRFYSCQGDILNIKGKYNDCLTLLQKGLQFSIAAKDKIREGIMYENIGNTLGLMDRIDSATVCYFKALNIFENLRDTVKMAIVYSNLSGVYSKTNQLKNALKYSEKGLMVTQKKRDIYYQGALINYETILWKLNWYAKADSVNKEIIKLAEELEDYWGLSDAIVNLCSHSLERKQYAPLTYYANELSKVCQHINSEEKDCLAYYWLAVAAYFNQNFELAEKHIQKSLNIAERDTLTKRLKECYALMAKIILAKTHNVELAERFTFKADSIKQLTFNENILTAIHNAEQKYESEKKDVQIQLQKTALKSARIWRIVLLFLLLLLSVVAVIYLRYYKNKQSLLLKDKELQQQKIVRLENEKQLSATQAILRGQEEERSRMAKDLHDGLGGILSSVKYSFHRAKPQLVLSEENAQAFEKSMFLLDESIAELRRVAHNLMPETLMKLTLNDALQDFCQQVQEYTSISITYQSFGMEGILMDNAVKTTTYRIVQELMNNILKHANATQIMVQLLVKEEVLHITIEDNGKGFNVSDLDSSGGMGYKNILSRVNYLKGQMDVQSVKEEGTSVYIEIPLK